MRRGLTTADSHVPARVPAADNSGPMEWYYLMTFVHASVRLGVFGRERFHYWGLLLWTFFRRPSLVPLAVTLSIYGHHFRKTSLALGL